MKHFYLLALTCIFSCSLPSPIITLKPTTDSGIWRYGYKIQSFEKNGIQVKSAFFSDELNNLVFLIHIKNKTENEILFEPEKCFYMAYDKDKNFLQTIFAQNPTTQISYLEKKLENERKSYDNKTAADAIFGIVDIVSDVANIGKKNSLAEVKKEEREDKKNRVEQENSQTRYQERLGYIENKKDQWNTALKKHTLLPNESITGKVYFSKIKKIFYLNLNILIGKVPLQFKYEIKEVIY